MNGAQGAQANLYSPQYPPKTAAQRATFEALLRAIGIGIGNTAAHEIGHQLGLPHMDCDKGGLFPDCSQPTKHPDPAFLYEYWQQEAPMYLDIGDPLGWDTVDAPVLSDQLLKK
jgi:hypothetical protein